MWILEHPVGSARATGLYTLAGPPTRLTRLRQAAYREHVRCVGGGLQDVWPGFELNCYR